MELRFEKVSDEDCKDAMIMSYGLTVRYDKKGGHSALVVAKRDYSGDIKIDRIFHDAEADFVYGLLTGKIRVVEEKAEPVIPTIKLKEAFTKGRGYNSFEELMEDVLCRT